MTRKVFIDCGANKGFAIDGYRKKYDPEHDTEIIAFECFPECINFLQKKYSDITIIKKAVYTGEGLLQFNTGTTTRSGTLRNDKRLFQTGNSILVESIDFSAWMFENLNPDDNVTVCMDIEGAEYEIIPKLIKTGAIDLIDKFYVEWHNMKLTDITQGQHNSVEEFLTSAFVGKELVMGTSNTWDISK